MKRLLALVPLCLVAACGEAPVASPAPLTAQVTTAAPEALPTKAELPFAKNAAPLVDDAPVVVVDREHVLLDDQVVGDVAALGSLGKARKIDGEFDGLKAKRAAWKEAHRGGPFPGVALLRINRATKALVVKDVFQTAAFAGFPNLAFAVETAGGTVGRIDADAHVPGPPDPGVGLGPSKPAEPVLFIHLDPSKQVVLVWQRGPEKLAENDVPWSEAFQREGEIVKAPALATKLFKEWSAQASHRDPGDKKLDRVVVSTEDGAELRDLVAVLDALAETKRDITGVGPRQQAFNVTFSLRGSVPTSGPIVPMPGGGTSVNGRLAPEIIQRIVRQNYGGIRACYEAGLKKDASLAGRVAAKFVIGTDGKVSKAVADPSTDLRDPVVVACVIKGFGVLSFPAPEGGIVTVVYPIVFSPASP